MSINNKGKRELPPTHPGLILREDFMPDYGLNVTNLADTLSMSRQTINELIRERRALSPAMNLRLSRLFGNSPEFWLNAQRAVDLWQAEKELAKDLALDTPDEVRCNSFPIWIPLLLQQSRHV